MIGSDPCQLPGVVRHVTDAEITGAYARLTTVFDPRRWAASPDRRHEAQAWTNSVNEARGLILASSGPSGVTCPPAGIPR